MVYSIQNQSFYLKLGVISATANSETLHKSRSVLKKICQHCGMGQIT